MPGLAPGAALLASCSHGDPAVIALTGDLDSYTAIVVERAAAVTLVRSRVRRAIVMDLAGVTFLSVAGIQTVHATVDQAAARGVALRIALDSRSTRARSRTAR